MTIPSRRTWRRAERGFTIPEMLTSLATFSLVGTAMVSVVIGTLSSASYQAHMVDAQLDVATGMILVQNDLRDAGYVPDGMNQAIFQQVTTGSTTDSVQFVGDVNSDGISERITYAVDDGWLMRTQDVWNGSGWTTGSPQPVAANVMLFTLKFYLVDPCLGSIAQETASQVLGGKVSFINISLTGKGTYKGRTIIKTLTSDMTERQLNVLPTC